MMKNTIGHRLTEKATQFGELYTPEEALIMNLVDEIIEPDELMSQALRALEEWLYIPSE